MDYNEPIKVLGLVAKDSERLRDSASGGAFAVLASALLKTGGVVFGAEMTDTCEVRHVGITSIEELRILQGSKYVWSNLGNTFEECRRYLTEGRRVLFSGTPCQIAALHTYLDRNANQSSIGDLLITVDIICHGTPSQKLYKAYIEWLEKQLDTDDGIHGYTFRSKRVGWGAYCYEYYYYRNHKRVDVCGLSGDDPYYSAFAKGISFRSSCYSCRFARIDRVSDFTIGDFWGVELLLPEFYNRNGVSCLLINTQTALEYFNTYCVNDCYSIETSADDVVQYNCNLNSPAVRSDADKKLMDDVYDSLSLGEYDRVFNVLLTKDYGLRSRILRCIPVRLKRLLFDLRRFSRGVLRRIT